MATPESVAGKIAQRVTELLAPLDAEMTVNKWPADFRRIMWDAVAQQASILAADTEQQTKR